MNSKQVLDEITILQDVIDELPSPPDSELVAQVMRTWEARLQLIAVAAGRLAESKNPEVVTLAGLCVIMAEGLGQLAAGQR